MTGAWRCSSCAINWPLQGAFSTDCPICEGPTWRHTEGEPIPLQEARNLRNAAHDDRAREVARRQRIEAFEAQCQDAEVTAAMATFDAELGSLLC